MKQSYEDFKKTVHMEEGADGFENLVDKLEREAMKMTWEERCERYRANQSTHAPAQVVTPVGFNA